MNSSSNVTILAIFSTLFVKKSLYPYVDIVLDASNADLDFIQRLVFPIH